ncbi:hypothetical protein BCR35DRAFT_310521 [Leucosporidium creatinivorum]|uniref:F-box domain-containing protein n=1 Tax=Leucosporidium creatinivorum TaxID=106004 RepID=A0A1Y2D2Q2_9BASI|nr:hypothetical protein BCR35DRAFT_310521 [Leucosporidium creatinivorum]
MAVIQDLPPELLRRIIELIDRSGWPTPYRSLCRAALVARAWRGPSQDVLICTVTFAGFDAASDGRTPRPSISSRTLDCAVLGAHRWAQKVLELLTEAEATVRSLRIMYTTGNDLDLGIMTFEMLAGLHSLNIGGRFEGQPPIPSAATIELRTLLLRPECLPSPAFLESLLGAAPTIDLHGFVASCTSLRSLKLYYATPESITKTLAAVRSPLVLLATELGAKWIRGADAKEIAELVDVLKHPSLAQLKRWRIWGYGQFSNPLRNDGRTQWEEACRARGVEPRGNRRFFTGESASRYYPAE